MKHLKGIILLIVTTILLSCLFSMIAVHLSADTFRKSDFLMAFPIVFVMCSVVMLVTISIHRHFPRTLLWVSVSACTIFALLMIVGFVRQDLYDIFDIQLLALTGICCCIAVVFLISRYFFTLQKTLLIMSFVTLLAMVCLAFQLRYTHGGVNWKSYLLCNPRFATEEKGDQHFHYIKTKNYLCIPRDWQDAMRDNMEYNDRKTHFRGHIPVLNIHPDAFSADSRKALSGEELHHWVITIHDKTYFLRKVRGAPVYFEIDEKTLEYLGDEKYRDKNGEIHNGIRI